MNIEPSIATMFVAFVAAVSGFAAQKASVKATTHAADESSRVLMEKEAYERARHFDIETITRQSDQITRQAEEIDGLRTEVDELHEKVRVLMTQVRQLESGLHNEREY